MNDIYCPGPTLKLNWQLSRNEWIPENYYWWPTEITWPYVAMNGKWYGQHVVDVTYYELDATYVESLQKMLDQDSKYHSQLMNHMTENANENDKDDKRLLEAIDSWKTDASHVCFWKCLDFFFLFCICFLFIVCFLSLFVL